MKIYIERVQGVGPYEGIIGAAHIEHAGQHLLCHIWEPLPGKAGKAGNPVSSTRAGKDTPQWVLDYGTRRLLQEIGEAWEASRKGGMPSNPWH